MEDFVRKIIQKFESAYDSKNSLGLFEDWAKFDDYYFGRVNFSQSKDDPGSSTNIILPNIESQIADLVDQPWDVMAKGEEPSDHLFAVHIQHILRWILHKNKLVFKLDRHERGRLKLGTSGWKVWFDPNALRGRGLPIIDALNPVNLFPDPKVTVADELQEGDFVIHATHKPINWIKRHPQFRDNAKELQPADYFSSRSIKIFDNESDDEIDTISRDKALYMECWQKDIEDGVPFLRLTVVANNIKLYDSKEHRKRSGSLNFYKHGKYPFVITPCYQREGMLWGVGDVELLIPTQDIINDFDDQIRRNARLMGNIQKVIGIASGINPKKWTNKAGLNIIARDPLAWKMVEPPNMPPYIMNRRSEAMNNEAQVISGRTDVVEGRKPGSLRAAAAILALQEAGNRRANHKRLMLQAGMQEVMDILVDYVKEYFTEERAYRILGSKNEDYIWFKGSKLKEIPRLIPRPQVNPETGEEEYSLTPLLDEQGKEMTKEAVFDLEFSIGAGMPTNKSFLYQSVNELHQNGIVTTEEARQFLKEQMNWPIIEPLNPVGTFAGRNVPPEVTQQMNMQQGIMPPEMGGGGGDQIPPEVIQQLLAQFGGMPNAG